MTVWHGCIPHFVCLRNSPKGFEKIALGCRAAATQGSKRAKPTETPTGFRSRTAARRNPFRVDGRAIGLLPRVVAARQPWATLQKPFGLSRRANCPMP